MSSSPTEQEYKFESLGNIQIKYAALEPGEIVAAKVHTMCNMLDITVGQAVTYKIRDDYYDDHRGTLAAVNCSFRRRVVDRDRRVTIKVPAPTATHVALHRFEDEFECSDQEFSRLMTDPRRLDEFLAVHQLPPRVSDLTHQLTVDNTRTSLALITGQGHYELSYDKYHYYTPDGGRYSEYFAEIEVEVMGDVIPEDVQLTKLLTAMPLLLNAQPGSASKLERGLYWMRHPDSAVTMYAIAFDLVRYSLRTSDVQKQNILLFNNLTKEAIQELRGKGAEKDVLYLPTGDGMILLFNDRPETIVPVACLLQEKVKRSNGRLPEAERLSFRTGLHAGAVFRYSDVNGNVNVAGDGINMAVRAMSFGDEWSVLATHEAFEAFGRIDRDLAQFFTLIGDRRTKHDVTLRLYNVQQFERGCGSPSPLPKE